MHLVGGILQGVDWDRRWAIIGGQPFELLPGLPVVSGLGPGTGVVAFVAERDGRRQVVHLRPTAVPHFVASAG
jgi:hypothetical protein